MGGCVKGGLGGGLCEGNAEHEGVWGESGIFAMAADGPSATHWVSMGGGWCGGDESRLGAWGCESGQACHPPATHSVS